LGKGLGALIRDAEVAPQAIPTAAAAAATAAVPAAGSRRRAIAGDIDLLDPNPYQPRTKFARAGSKVAQSIRPAALSSR